MMLFSQKTLAMPHDVVFSKKFDAVHMTVRSPQISGRELL
jgi:hypothetical protein